jgi:DNA polymerase-3 subunit beta
MRTSAEKIKKELGLIGQVVKGRAHLPILDNVMLTADEIVGSNLNFEITIRDAFMQDMDPFTPCLVLMADLKKAIASAPKNAEITFANAGKFLRVTFGRSVVEIASTPVSEFPIKMFDPKPVATVEKTVLDDVARIMPNFVAHEILRPEMEGVFFGGNVFAATDAHKLATFHIEGTKCEPVIIPPLALTLAASASGEDVVIGREFIQCGNLRLAFTTIEGRYPKYEAVIPQSNPLEFKVNKYELLEAVRVAQSTSSVTASLGKFEFSGGSLVVSSEDIDASKRSATTIEAQSNDTLVIGFNLEYLVTVLNATEDDHIIIRATAPNRAMIIEHERGILLLMPVAVPQ